MSPSSNSQERLTMPARFHFGRQGHVCAYGRLYSEMREILKLAIPTVLGLVSTVAMGAIDTAMLAPLGNDVVAAVGLSTSAFIFINSAVIGFASVIGVGIAKASGTGDGTQVSRSMMSGLAFTAILSLLAAVTMTATAQLVSSLAPNASVASLTQTYWLAMTLAVVPHTMLAALRSAYTALGHPWTALVIILIGIGLNIPLNQILIHGVAGLEGLGVFGAGVASLLAKAAAVAIFVIHWRTAKRMKVSRGNFSLSFKAVATLAREGIPVATGSVAEGGAYAVTGFMAAMLGAMALAAHQVVHSIGVLFYMVPIGMMIASSIRTGQLLGAERKTDITCSLKAANLVTLSWSVSVLLFVLAFRLPIAEVLSPAQDVASLAAPLLLTMVFVQFADCVQSNALGVLRGLSDNIVPNALTVLAYWLLALPLAAFFGLFLDYGVVGISLGYGLVVLAVAGVLQIRAVRLSMIS
ncbi:MAG: MATE family efflux transporter [Pseudomonadota bacterium]